MGTSVTLNQNGRDKVFTDIAFETIRDEELKPAKSHFAYLCTASGEVFKVSNQ